MFPELPANLSDLSDEDLGRLIDEYVAAIADGAPNVRTAEEVAALEAAGQNLAALRADAERRESEQAEIVQRAQAVVDAANATAEPAEGAEGTEGGEGDGADGGETQPAEGAEGAPAEQESVTAGAAAPAVTRRIPAIPQRPALSSISGRQPAGSQPDPRRPSNLRILAAPDLPNFSTGQDLNMAQVANAMVERHERLGRSQGVDGEVVGIATIEASIPTDRFLTSVASPVDNTGRVEAVTAALRSASVDEMDSLTAAGGLCAPVAPYYDILVVADSARPIRDFLPGFGADRGGITLIPPPTLASVSPIARTVADGATTNASATVTSATAAFDARDVGATIAGAGIPAGAYIVSVTNATTVVISANATATAAGVSITITRLGTVGYITATQDAAALNGTAAQQIAAQKPCLHVVCGNPQTYTVDAISRCLEFGNFSARAYPEQVSSWIDLSMAAHARRAETSLLDQIAANSVAVTAALALGAGAEVFARAAQLAEGYRSRNRMSEDASLDALYPSWTVGLINADRVRAGVEPLTRAEIEARFRATAGLRIGWYVDSKTGGGQVFGTQSVGAALTFPSTLVWYLFAPGTFLFLDGGTLDFGLVRDSTLNARNDYRIMVETFEKIAFTGFESLEVTQTVCATGEIGARRTGGAALVCPV
jgi:hypothetical protein